jgi:hypothetical protein
MVPEAPLEQTDAGLVPKGEGWFVVNAKEARWFEHEKFGSGTVFEGEPAFSSPASLRVSTTVKTHRRTSSSSGVSACCSSKVRNAP